MTHDVQIEIPLSKQKMILTLLGSIVFVGLGIWFLINPPKISNPFFGNPTLIFIVGLASILFFGLVAITIFRKFSDKQPGLVISRQGITDNSSGVSAGLIPWTDIQEIKVSQVMSQKFLMFIVSNPQDYLDKVTNPIKRNAMKMNYKTYGSPISISSNALQTNFDDLEKLLVEKMNEYKS
ncbi:STM3941 family protein [Chryseobacterium koreense]